MSINAEYSWMPLWRDPRYWIHPDGTVVGIRKHKLSPKISQDGYVKIKVNHNYTGLARLLAETFLREGYSKEKQVNHIDGNKLNNQLDNLEWVTQQENLYHAMDTGLHALGRQSVEAICPKTGDVVGLFSSQSEADRQGMAKQGNITKVLNGKRKKAGGYYWRKA